MEKKKTISVVMIVKNEEAVLARCLESVKDADEIIICDTGSTDGTIEIAKKYTDKVYTDFTWCDDYAKARNHAKSKATCEWILSIDADEVLHDFSEVRRVVELGTNAIRVTMIGESDNDLEFPFSRLFRNCPEIFWCEPVHNHLNVPGEGELIGDVKITFGWSPAHAADPDRALRMLEKAVKDDPTPRRLYYLGREYWYKQDYEKCVVTLGRQVQIDFFEAQRADGFLIMSQAFSALGRDQDARDACAQAIIINPHFKEAVEWMAGISVDHNASIWRKWATFCENRDVLVMRSRANQ